MICWRRLDEEPIGKLFHDLVQLWADGQTTGFLRPFFGGGRLAGVGKKDAVAKPISLETDARPIVLGLTWRKLVFRATFALDRAKTRERLGDQHWSSQKIELRLWLTLHAWAQQSRDDSCTVIL